MRLDGFTLEPRDGFDLRVEMRPDETTEPIRSSYTDQDLEAWDADSWEYVALRVVASKRGVSVSRDLGEAWLWGVEHGWFRSDVDGPIPEHYVNPVDPRSSGYAGEDIAELVEEAITQAKLELESLVS